MKAPIEQVFDMVSDPEKFMAFRNPLSTDIKVERVTKGPMSVGTTWLFRAEFWGRDLEWNTQLTEWNSPYYSASEQTGSGPFKSARWEHKLALSESKKEVVKYTLTLKYEVSDWLERRRPEVEAMLGKMYTEIAKRIRLHFEAKRE